MKIDWGLDYQYQKNLEQRWVTDNRMRQGEPTRDWDSSKYYWGSYLQTDGDVTDWLRLIAALRVDVMDGEMTNRATGVTTDMVDMDYIWQPKAGMIVAPWDGYNFYGNYGRTFQTPSSPTLFGQSSGGDLISRGILRRRINVTALRKNNGFDSDGGGYDLLFVCSDTRRECP